MVQAQIEISEHANRVINIIKAKYGVKNKSEAIEVMAREYEKRLLEPELKPAFVKRIKKAERGKFVKVKDVDAYFEKLLG